MSEQDLLEMAEDCKVRIEEKNKQLNKLKGQNMTLTKALNEINVASHSMFAILELLQTITTGSRTGTENIIYNKLFNYISDIDNVYTTMNQMNPISESIEMDFLTQFTISQLQ